MNQKIFCKVLLFLHILFNFTAFVSADAGPKPSLTIYVVNEADGEYYLDILVDEYSEFGFALRVKDESTEYKHLKIYQYDEGLFKAVGVHSGIVNFNIKGKPHFFNSYRHKFSYRVPREFKVIYEDPEGNLQISNLIETNNFYASAVYDAKTNELHEMKAGFIYLHNLQITFGFIFRLVATIIIELFIASLFKICKIAKEKKTLIYTNIYTQIYLTIVFITSYYTMLRNYPLITFLVLEASIIFIEYNIYKKHYKDCSHKVLIAYTIIANLITMYLGYWMAF